MKKNLDLAGLSLGVAVVLLCGGCGRPKSQNDSAAETASVDIYRVERHAFPRRLEFPATLAAAQTVVLMSKLPGEVREVRAHEGQSVRTGDPLILLDRSDFELAVKQARAQLAAAEAAVAIAKAGLENMDAKHRRFSVLRQRDAIPEAQFEEVETGQRAAAAQVQGAEAQVRLARVAVEVAESNLEHTVIRAPFNGVVAKRMVDPGARVQTMPPTALMTVVDPSRIKVEGSLSEKDMGLIARGAPASIFVDALGATPFKAQIDDVEPLVDGQTRTGAVRFILHNADRRLKGGMSARVVMTVDNVEAAAVPDDAVLKGELTTDRGEVFVLSSDVAKLREVSLGLRDGELVQVISGLSGGEIIVRGGQQLLHDGQRVVVRTAGTPAPASGTPGSQQRPARRENGR
jgi:HlyD family secretion protein